MGACARFIGNYRRWALFCHGLLEDARLAGRSGGRIGQLPEVGPPMKMFRNRSWMISRGTTRARPYHHARKSQQSIYTHALGHDNALHCLERLTFPPPPLSHHPITGCALRKGLSLLGQREARATTSPRLFTITTTILSHHLRPHHHRGVVSGRRTSSRSVCPRAPRTA